MPPKRKATKVGNKGTTPPAKKAKKSPKETAPKKKASTKKASKKEKQVPTETAPVANTDTAASAGGPLKTYLTDSSWNKLLKNEFEEDYFKQLEKQLASDYKSSKEIFPPKKLIFNAFNLCPSDKIKLVILGQDPYHDDGQAHGLSFSVQKGIKVPSSLANVYKELAKDIPGFKAPTHGCLVDWAKQGVLLLNATLTVEAHKPNSHAKYGWQTFTNHVIKCISDNCEKVVFLLWGGFAHKKEALINTSKHSVIKTAHPSGLSYSKFKDCNCFSAVNKALKKFGKTPIDWNLA